MAPTREGSHRAADLAGLASRIGRGAAAASGGSRGAEGGAAQQGQRHEHDQHRDVQPAQPPPAPLEISTQVSLCLRSHAIVITPVRGNQLTPVQSSVCEVHR